MRILLNGESFELPDGETVAALLTRLDLTGRSRRSGTQPGYRPA
ncbi:sulfur carrier protein ThiS [Pseudomonas tolaasii]